MRVGDLFPKDFFQPTQSSSHDRKQGGDAQAAKASLAHSSMAPQPPDVSRTRTQQQLTVIRKHSDESATTADVPSATNKMPWKCSDKHAPDQATITWNAADFPALPMPKKMATEPTTAVLGKPQPQPVHILKRPTAEKQDATAALASTITPEPSQPKSTPPAVASTSPSKVAKESSPKISAALSLLQPVTVPPPRDQTGDEHAFFRLFQNKQVVVPAAGGALKGGRQRLRPRRKNFSTLKKRILQERLQRWRDRNPETTDETQEGSSSNVGENADDGKPKAASCTVCLTGFTDLSELEDDDEYEEIVENLRDLASKVGPMKWLLVPRERIAAKTLEDSSETAHVSFVKFESPQDAAAAVACWEGLVLGGHALKATAAAVEPSSFANEKEWQTWCVTDAMMRPKIKDGDTSNAVTEVILENALTEDDLDDEDCLQESVNDIRTLAEKYGSVVDVRVERGPPALLYVRYTGDETLARTAAAELDKAVIGGIKISARLVLDVDKKCSTSTRGESANWICLDNILTEDDVEDEDCLQESLADIKELAQKFGSVLHVELDPSTSERAVRVYFSEDSPEAAKLAQEGFNGLTIGGLTVTATFRGNQTVSSCQQTVLSAVSKPEASKKEETTEMLSSGGKRIPERFAEMKRAPKIANPGVPRPYATICGNDYVKKLLTDMLGELMRLQKRAINDKNAKARRRIVMGLREVARGIRAHKVKMVVIANNLDDYEALDERLKELIDLAFKEGVPIFYEFSKRALGKAVGKTIKVAVVGVQSADGANQEFKKLLNLAPL